MRYVAVAGLPGSGKTTVAMALAERGYAYFSMGDVVRREAERLGVTPDRASVLLRLAHGRRAVASLVAAQVAGAERAVIDGVRSREEVEAFEDVLGEVFVIFVVASRGTRFKRLSGRGRPDDPAAYHQFLMRDLRELRFGLGEVLARADAVIVNEGRSVEEIKRELWALL